jgi:hypothetical protein
MKQRFLTYLICVTLIGSMLSWGSFFARATGGRGTGNSWYSHSWSSGFGSGFASGHGGFAGSMGGGHK